MRLVADNFGLKIGIEGEKEFKKALSEINQSFKVLGSEMKLVSSQFDANDKSIQALSARNTVLNKEIDAQRQKIETLRAALQNASESFGENDRRTQNWQIQLNNAEAALNGMERELSANERAMESLSQQETEAADATERLSQEISRQEDELAGMKRAYSNAVLEYGKGSSEAKELEGRISQLSGELRENRERMKDAGDVAEDFGDSLEDASNRADKLGSGLSVATVAMGNLISSGIQAALSGIQELGSAIWNLDEATEEYRVAQGKLTTAFEAAGYSGDAAQKSYTEFYKILGDTDTATEASQLLAQLAQNEQDITKWTNIAAGVYGTFGDALPIEGMIESANETAKVGQVTGSLADALNWVGISEDAFNEKLAACSSESERNRLIMDTLSGAYDEASSAFYRNNEALVASREGQAQLDETLAGLGETISNVKNNLRAEFLPAISEVISAFTDMVNGVDGADEAFAGAITGLVNTAVSMLPQFVDTGMQMLTSLLSGIIQSLPAVMEGAAQIIVTLAQGIAAAVPTLIPQIVLVVTQIVQTLIENLPMILDAALQLITGLAQGLLNAIPVLIAALPAIITAIVEFIVGAIPQIINAGIQLLTSLVSALPEIITAIVASIPQIIDGLVTAILGSIPQINDAGVNLLISLIQNLPTIITTIVGAIPQIISSLVNAILNSIPQIIQAGVQLRKDCWTDERRAAKGRYVQEHQLGPNSSCFTSRIRCDSCGENYRRQRSRHKDGSFDSVWRCASGGKCNSPSIKEEVLKNLCADAMGLESFDETAFREQIACIHIVAPFQLSIRFFDGHTFEAAWENKRKMPKHTEQRKQHMREVMIQKWREKCGESNDYTGDDKPVHGNADQ